MNDYIYVSSTYDKIYSLYSSLIDGEVFNEERTMSIIINQCSQILICMEEYPINSEINEKYKNVLDILKNTIDKKCAKRIN